MKKKPKKTRKQLIKLAWEAFSAFIKRRDTDWRGYGKCISCGKTLNLEENPGECHAGHFEHGHQKESYYDEDNVHLQCRQCNFYGGAKTIKQFTINLIAKIGLKKVESLQKPKTKYWNNKELEEIIQIYGLN